MSRVPPSLYSFCFRADIVAVFICMSLQAALSNAQEPSQASGELVRTQCSSSEVTVRSRYPSDARSVCSGALAAIEFFREHGAETCEALQIEVVDQLPPGTDASAVGCFSPIDRKSYVLSYQMFVKGREWFGLQIDRRLYESIASHEITHALTSCTAASRSLTTKAIEYIAFVTMLTTMDPVQLNALLSANPGIEFESESEISEMGYALNQMRFGIMAYRHYLRQPDRAGFIQALLGGRVLTHLYYYY